MNSFKQQCINLRKKDYTLNEIVTITGRPKSSIHAHIKDIPLSLKKQDEIKKATIQKAKRIAASRKGKALRSYLPFMQWSPQLVLLVGHLMFDGSITRGRCVYHNRSETLIGRVGRLMRQVYAYEPREYRDSASGVIRIEYGNIELQGFLQRKSYELLSGISDMSKQQQREFLRAFFDDEGCMDYRPMRNLRQVRGYQNDVHILKLIQKLLKNFHIESRMKGRNEVVITGKRNLQNFQKEINFSPGVALNPKRKNSIWKKPIEKRTLLDRAIKSFKT